MAIMKSLDHINIIRLYEVYDYKSHYVLILELC
jgi:serine/threonine protein kinase